MSFLNSLITSKLRIHTLGITNGPLRLIQQGASDVTVGEKVASDGIKTTTNKHWLLSPNHTQSLKASITISET